MWFYTSITPQFKTLESQRNYSFQNRIRLTSLQHGALSKIKVYYQQYTTTTIDRVHYVTIYFKRLNYILTIGLNNKAMTNTKGREKIISKIIACLYKHWFSHAQLTEQLIELETLYHCNSA